MIEPKIPSLEDVNRIVINRIAIWNREGKSELWWKVAGGPGFHSAGIPALTNDMQALIEKRLLRLHLVQKFENQDVTIFEEKLTYRWWKSGDTLNIVRRDLPVQERPPGGNIHGS